MGSSLLDERWWSRASSSLMLSVRLCCAGLLWVIEAEEGGFIEEETASFDRTLLQFFRRHETSLSFCGVESALHLARLISVWK